MTPETPSVLVQWACDRWHGAGESGPFPPPLVGAGSRRTTERARHDNSGIDRRGRRITRQGIDPRRMTLYETARTFESLGVSEELTKALADQGIVSAFPIQALTIADALAGRDVCGKAKTGSGKTLAFGVPAPPAHQGDQGRAGPAVGAGPTGAAPGPGAPSHAGTGRPGARRAGSAGQDARSARRRRLRRRRHRPPGGEAAEGRRCHHRHAGTPHRPGGPGRDLRVAARDAGARRGRPHGGHGVHAPGRVGAPPARDAPSDAPLLGHARRRRRSARAALPDRARLPRGGVVHPDGDRSWSTGSSRCTRWTR